jgi:hypothetical protein
MTQCSVRFTSVGKREIQKDVGCRWSGEEVVFWVVLYCVDYLMLLLLQRVADGEFEFELDLGAEVRGP